jgi:hypothetical protein
VAFETRQISENHPAAQFETRTIGEIPIEDSQVVATRPQFLFSETGTKSDVYRIPLSAETSGYRIGKVALVFNHENAHSSER